MPPPPDSRSHADAREPGLHRVPRGEGRLPHSLTPTLKPGVLALLEGTNQIYKESIGIFQRANLSQRFGALPEVIPIKNRIQVIQDLLEKRLKASSKEKQQQKCKTKPHQDTWASHFPCEGTISGQPAVCSVGINANFC